MMVLNVRTKISETNRFQEEIIGILFEYLCYKGLKKKDLQLL